MHFIEINGGFLSFYMEGMLEKKGTKNERDIRRSFCQTIQKYDKYI